MCHGDVGKITFQWSPQNLVPFANSNTHQCVNWDKLGGWIKDRSVDLLKPGWLVHPTMGVVFPDGEGGKLGVATGDQNVNAEHNHGNISN